MTTLELEELISEIPYLSDGALVAMVEAASVCLCDQRHSNGVDFKVNGEFKQTFSLHWPKVTPQMKAAWNDLEIATENGAYGIAILLLKKLASLPAILQSRKKTGFDYWLTDGSGNFDARLEVSGILNGTASNIQSRLKKKLKQTDPSDDTSLPAYAAIIEFSTPTSSIAKKKIK